MALLHLVSEFYSGENFTIQWIPPQCFIRGTALIMKNIFTPEFADLKCLETSLYFVSSRVSLCRELPSSLCYLVSTGGQHEYFLDFSQVAEKKLQMFQLCFLSS